MESQITVSEFNTRQYSKAVDEFNKRLVKLSNDLFEITGNERFHNFTEYCTNEFEIGKKTTFVYQFIQKAESDIYERVAKGDRSVINSDISGNIDLRIIEELRQVYTTLTQNNQDVIFKCFQQIFQIAKYIKNNFYEQLLEDSI